MAKIKSRRLARSLALQMCYLFDIRKIDGSEKAAELFDIYAGELDDISEHVIEHAKELVNGIFENRFEIDGLIRMNMTGWQPERMGIIERAAVYLALYEGIVGRKVDIPVAISEAVELAKEFGSEESARFVNGVLGRIVRAAGAVSGLPLSDDSSG